MTALELIGVSKHYRERRALRGVDFAVEEGSALGLLGPNGAGKTTALRLLLGFTRPTTGSVRLRGLPPGDPEARLGLGYLPERLALPGRMSVREFLKLHASLAGLIGAERDREIDEVLEFTGVADRAHEKIEKLSKGLSQRVGFAQAFLGRPSLLLLDEPTSGLDPIGVRDARSWILRARERGCTILISSHILSEIERTCDAIAILDRGRIVASGSIDEIVEDGETLEDAFVRLVRP